MVAGLVGNLQWKSAHARYDTFKRGGAAPGPMTSLKLVYVYKCLKMSKLDDILTARHLDRRDLQRVCSKVHRDEFSKRIRDWKAVGTALGLSQEQLDAIDAAHESEEQKKTILFDQWSERDGEKATYLKLAEVLFAGQLDLLQELCSILADATPHPPASLGK